MKEREKPSYFHCSVSYYLIISSTMSFWNGKRAHATYPGDFIEFGCEDLTVSTPGREEVDDPGLIAGEDSLEAVPIQAGDRTREELVRPRTQGLSVTEPTVVLAANEPWTEIGGCPVAQDMF
jgi:hypothetical protein